jgi:3'-5' exoribonuclease
MAGTGVAVLRLSELQDGDEAVCFAALARKVRGTTKKNESFVKCYFRDKRVVLEAPVWPGSPFIKEAESWAEGEAYRLQVRALHSPDYGLQLTILKIRAAVDGDAAEGFDFADLFEASRFDPDDRLQKIRDLVEKEVDDHFLKELVFSILDDNAALFKKMPAAQTFHHGYTSGLIEHVWSMTRIATFLAKHYAEYYKALDPPLNKSLIVAATVLHDIGKVRELEYHPVETTYSKRGYLIGHILMGRDMARAAAARIEGFPEETLMLLEHAILAHHGKREFGSPVLPQTTEALLVAHIDELDAKMNNAARARLTSTTAGPFTDKVFALDNRRFYKGVPTQADSGEEAPELP